VIFLLNTRKAVSPKVITTFFPPSYPPCIP
jgi:hypothetical protein